MKNQQAAQRRAILSEGMKDRSIAFFFSGDVRQRTWDQNYPFSVDRSFFYLTGLDEPGDILVLSKLSGEVTERLFVARPDPYLEMYHGHMPTDEEYKADIGIEHVFYHDKFDWVIGRLLARSFFETLYMDFHQRDLGDFTMPENAMAKRILSAHPSLKTENLARTIANMRRVKSPEEIADIRRAIEITGKGIAEILNNLRPGAWENALQAHFEFRIKSEGATGNAFQPIVAGGGNSVLLHYERNNQQLRDGDLLLLDLGAEYNNYSADISRTFPVNGRFTERQRYFYNAVLAAQEAVIKALKPGLKIDSTADIARDALYPFCKEAGVAKARADMEKLLPHGVCHYLGLDTHDVGDRDVLLPGMVVTIEPGVYLKELGFGIRIEDDALITGDGCELLSSQILKQPNELEDFILYAKEKE